MSNEHNPIAILVAKIQNKWNTEASPNKELKIARWIIKPDQGRLFEGFLKLESTPHGSIPEVLITLLTPFHTFKQHSQELAKDWIESFEKDTKTAQALEAEGASFVWNTNSYKTKLAQKDTDYDLLLLEMLSSFHKALADPNKKLVLALLPKTVADVDDYKKWLENLLKLGIPDKTCIMIFDYAEELYFDVLNRKYPTLVKALAVELDLKGAMNKIAQAGDPNSPEVQFRKCMMEMSEAVTAKNLEALHKWGKKGLEITQKTGNKSFYSSAHLIYAGMLFTFKKYEEIDKLLAQGLGLALQGLKGGDNTCQSLIMQYYGYQAASKQHKGKEKEAADLFTKQGDVAHEYKLTAAALTAWWQAYNLYKKCDDRKHDEILEKAYSKGIELKSEELKSTCMAYIAYDYYQYCHNLRQFDKCKSIDEFMHAVEGENWKTQVEDYKESTKRKRFLIF